jgi:hypothetical protein
MKTELLIVLAVGVLLAISEAVAKEVGPPVTTDLSDAECHAFVTALSPKAKAVLVDGIYAMDKLTIAGWWKAPGEFRWKPFVLPIAVVAPCITAARDGVREPREAQ